MKKKNEAPQPKDVPLSTAPGTFKKNEKPRLTGTESAFFQRELTLTESRVQADAACERIAELEMLLEGAHARIADLQLAGFVGAPEWSEVNETWNTICRSAVDTSRLVGLEIELEGGQRYLIGDVSSDGGTGPANMPFPRAAVVKRARVLVRR